MFDDQFTIIYLAIVAPIGLIVILINRMLITREENKRKKNLLHIGGFESIKTSTPYDHPVDTAREDALENVSQRFTIIRRLSFYVLVFIWLIALIFPFLGKIPATLISVFVGASGVLVGLAARPFIENMISGIVISFSNPLKVGDTVIVDGHYGTVEDINIAYTTIKVWNWRRYVIPNGRMLQKEFINCSLNDKYQWAHVEFLVDYQASIDKVKSMAIEAAKNSKHFASHENPRFWVMEMGPNSIKCWVAAWANTPSDAWELGNDVRTKLITGFQKEQIKVHGFHLNLDQEALRHSPIS
jgi:small-conductance mechanosensitive channel